MIDIKALHEAATPAPWLSDDIEGVATDVAGFEVADCGQATAILTNYAEKTGIDHWASNTAITTVDRSDEECAANADLIVALRNAFASGDLIPRAEHEAELAAEREKVAALVEAAGVMVLPAGGGAPIDEDGNVIISMLPDEYDAIRKALAAISPTTCPTCGWEGHEPLPSYVTCTDPFHGEGA